jgi:ethanolamine ammonia-lyase small subunit
METPDSWTRLRDFTAARIALGRAGGSQPTGPLLDFRLAHARARDAVLAVFEPQELAGTLREMGCDPVVLDSCAPDRATYLQRPDFGRRLSNDARETLSALARQPGPDLVIMVSDGLSSLAAMEQSTPLLQALLPRLEADGWRLAPLFIVRHARVAIQDEVGGILSAGLSLILLGERPGLGSPDSLGAYFTHRPMPGKTDAARNCVSNIRAQGLPPEMAARKLHALLTASRRQGLSGVGLKDDVSFLPDSASPPPLAG